MKEKGFTLVEMLAVITILGILIGLSSVSIACVFKNSSYQEDINNSKVIQQSIENYYNNRDKSPVGGVISSFSSEVIESADKKFRVINENDTDGKVTYRNIDFKEEIIDKGFLYDIDFDKLSFNGKITKEDVIKYAVIYVDKETVSKEDYLKYSKFNNTLLLKQTSETCTNDKFNILLGSRKYKETSDSLNFKVDYNYIKCPLGEGKCIE